jgi:hypothetical protein
VFFPSRLSNFVCTGFPECVPQCDRVLESAETHSTAVCDSKLIHGNTPDSVTRHLEGHTEAEALFLAVADPPNEGGAD